MAKWAALDAPPACLHNRRRAEPNSDGSLYANRTKAMESRDAIIQLPGDAGERLPSAQMLQHSQPDLLCISR
jgi:hypothetical protein